jgi:hypothetical protein
VIVLFLTALLLLVKLPGVPEEVLLLSVNTAFGLADFVVILPLVTPEVELFRRLDTLLATRLSVLTSPLLLRATELVAIAVVPLLPLPSFRIIFVSVDLLLPYSDL